VDLEEADARELALMVGYGSYEGPRAGVLFTERNLLGWGQRLGTGVRASAKSYRGDITWTEPQLFASRTALSVTTFLHQREEPSFTDETVGVTAALSRRLLPHLQGRFGYTYEQRDGSDIDPTVNPSTVEEYTKASLFLELIRDTRDSPIFPTSGHQESLKIEHSDDAFGGSLNFDRIIFKTAGHIALSDAIGLALGAETGVLLPRDPGLLPIQERFFNGGESSVRSFRESELGPRAANGEFEGGEFRNVFNVEARFPLFGPIQWALFADAGNVGREVQDYGLRDMRYALGGGIRFALPIGPLRLDVGVNPDRRRDEDPFVIHFSIGYPF
jgi:outer membrane protein assembly factor BamA